MSTDRTSGLPPMIISDRTYAALRQSQGDGIDDVGPGEAFAVLGWPCLREKRAKPTPRIDLGPSPFVQSLTGSGL